MRTVLFRQVDRGGFIGDVERVRMTTAQWNMLRDLLVVHALIPGVTRRVRISRDERNSGFVFQVAGDAALPDDESRVVEIGWGGLHGEEDDRSAPSPRS